MKNCFSLLLISFLFSCSFSTHFIQTGSTTFPETSIENIKFYSEKPDRPYTIIGNVAADVAGDATLCRKRLKNEASKIGADAVIYLKITTMGSSNGRVGMNGIAVKFNTN